jgi:hypothetical protein
MPTDIGSLECEHINMALSDDQMRERAARLMDARWREMFDQRTSVSRRPRTVGTVAALGETLKLAQYAIGSRTDGDDDEGDSKNRGPRGEKMLPDVIAETRSKLTNDPMIKSRPGLLQAALDSIKFSKPAEHEVAVLGALESSIRHAYHELAEATFANIFKSSRVSLIHAEEALEGLASHARGLGWTDEGLLRVWSEVHTTKTDPGEQLHALTAAIHAPPQVFVCRVSVALGSSSGEDAFYDIPAYGVAMHKDQRCDARALDVECIARDSHEAALNAFRRVASIVGAPNVFQVTPNRVNSTKVQVRKKGESLPPEEIEISKNLPRDHHNPWKNQLKSVIELAARGGTETDTLYDAVRAHHKALGIEDVEASLILLWTAIERLCADPVNPSGALRSTSSLVPAAMAFSKVRREVQHFADSLTGLLSGAGEEGIDSSAIGFFELDSAVVRAERRVVSHKSILLALLGDEDAQRTFLAPFYNNSVLHAQWFARLRRQFSGGKNALDVNDLRTAIPAIIEDSRKRSEWQIKRLYRARNGLAHGSSRPIWVEDLARHANYYLTNALAICVRYSAEATSAPTARAVLATRQGWLDAYLKLAKEGDNIALAPDGLLKPSMLFSIPKPPGWNAH